MTDKKTQNHAPGLPVIYVHAKGRKQAGKTEIEPLLRLALPVCSRQPVAGEEQTVHGYGQPASLLAELARCYPGSPVIFLRAGLYPAKRDIDHLMRLQERADQPVVLTMLSNAAPTLNPFAGLHTEVPESSFDLPGMVRLLAPGYLHTLTQWADHFALLSAQAVQCLAAEEDGRSLLQVLHNAGGRLVVPDDLFLPDPSQKALTPSRLKAHESVRPPAFGELSARLQRWISAGITDLPFAGSPVRQAQERCVTLHITHSWGGGVALWIKSFIDADKHGLHFQLRSEESRSRQGFGQKLSLYAGNEDRCPVATWWLQPAIVSTVEEHADYQATVAQICRRYDIGRVLVSSLIGHSLEALRSGLPTLQILHDHFPIWPLLSVHPAPYLREGGGVDLEQALAQHLEDIEFPDKDASAWSKVRSTYLHAMNEFDTQAVAPGKSVLALQCKLEPAFEKITTNIIPHGFPVLPGRQVITPKPRSDGRRRLLVLGRMQTGKGRQLLLEAMPQLASLVQVYLLGAGQAGESFFGVPGVDVVLHYKRAELPSLLGEIGPDFSALLSVVPETFSFTLSELQQLGIPVIATRIGSFPDRIVHGKTGWLIDPEPAALVEQVSALCGKPAQIAAVRSNLGEPPACTPAEMVAAYNRLCPGLAQENGYVPVQSGYGEKQVSAADYQHALSLNELRESKRRQARLEREVEKRTAWAQQTGQQLKHEQQRRETWVKRLDTEVTRLQQMVADRQAQVSTMQTQLQATQNRVAQLKADHRQLETLNLQLETDYKQLAELNTLIISSSSWKITRPLRAVRRLARNFMLARAWNPARWPWLLSQLVRNLSTLGFEGTLKRLQYSGPEAVPEPRSETTAEPVGNPQPPLAFREFQHAEVSIVIPVYNQWAYTAACLRSLAEIGSSVSFEVIVVDDQSSDETADQLEQIKGLTYLRNDQNLGFVGSCNRGAGRARGDYLVLLNNDTQVTEGWLDALIDTFSSEPQTGLAGARLLYPDGRLQEAGGIVFSDGSGWNYGRGDEAERPEYHFLREVDYCSGACIALRTRFFHEIGALDERYAPAYYEDTDLAFRVREAGYKVMLQPLSVVIHHEGITSGTDTAAGAKKFQLVNQQKFIHRWKAELASQPEKISRPDDAAAIRAAARHYARGRILFIDATTPEPDQDSGSVRLTGLMHICRDLGYAVTFFADNRAYTGRYTRNLQQHGIEVLYRPWLESLHDFFRERGSEYDYVFISRHYVAINYLSLLKRFCPDARFIFDTVDLHYLREQRLAELEDSLPLRRTAEQTRRAEMSVIKAADATLVVSTVEQEVLAEDAPGEKVHVLSNIHAVPGSSTGFEDRRDLFFVGGYQHPPNIDAACWFVCEIWPLVHQQLPKARFHLVGSKAPEKVRSLKAEGVVFHGFVESLEPFLKDCRLAVAPLRYGAGIKGKVNMSMAHGQPVVATPAAVEGLFAKHEKDVLVAADAESFAAEVVRLYQDQALWERLSKASVSNVEAHFSVEAARASLIDLFKSL